MTVKLGPQRFMNEELRELSNHAIDPYTRRLAMCLKYIFTIFEEHCEQHPTHNSFEHQVLQSLHNMEATLSTQAQALARVEADNERLKLITQGILSGQAALATAMANANIRLFADLEALRNEIGSGNADRLTAIADSMDAQLETLQTVQTKLAEGAAAEDAVDPTLSISPTTATVAPGGQVQFSANRPVQWASNPSVGGSIDTSGLYTAPAEGATGDTITATAVDMQTATATVTIG